MEQLIRTHIARVFAIATSVFVIHNVFYPFFPLAQRAVFFLLIFTLLFLRSPRRGPKSLILDLVLAAASIAVFSYVALNAEEIIWRIGITTLPDLVLGTLAIVVALEATRLYVGWPLTALTAVFLAYAFLGYHIPYQFGGHGGFSFERIITYVFLSHNALFGVVVYILLRYVFLFVLFGKLLEVTGGLNFILGLAFALFGRFRGGPAMAAVGSSGLVGMVSGSGAANVMITGTVTIPLMKRFGFTPPVAGAMEAAASTGGTLMPPVMGAVAFLIMDYLGISYFEVIKAAFIPACLYYIGLFMAVAVYVRRAKIPKVSIEGLPSIREAVLRPESLIFFSSFAVLVGLLVMRYSPIMAVTSACATLAGLGLIVGTFSHLVLRKASMVEGMKRAFANGAKALETSAEDFRMLGAAGAAIGLSSGIILLTGLAGRMSSLVLTLGGGNLYLILVLCMVACLIMGMGLPPIVCYIILAIFVAPALIELGLLPLAVHLFVFYFGILSLITPPVCIVSYCAATLAEADFWRTGLHAFRLALPGFIIPFAFVLHPDYPLLMMGSPLTILISTVTACAGVLFIALALTGLPKSGTELTQRVLLLPAGVMLIMPIYWLSVLGLGIGLLGVLGPRLIKRISTTAKP